MHQNGVSIGLVSIRSLRPFPKTGLGRMLGNAKRIIVFEKSLAMGIRGVLALHVRYALGRFSEDVRVGTQRSNRLLVR